MILSRLLAWEVMLAHGLAGALFAAIQAVLLASAGVLVPVAIVSWLAGRTRAGSSGAGRPV